MLCRNCAYIVSSNNLHKRFGQSSRINPVGQQISQVFKKNILLRMSGSVQNQAILRWAFEKSSIKGTSQQCLRAWFDPASGAVPRFAGSRWSSGLPQSPRSQAEPRALAPAPFPFPGSGEAPALPSPRGSVSPCSWAGPGKLSDWELQQRYYRQMSFFFVGFFPLINIFAWLIKFINEAISLLSK